MQEHVNSILAPEFEKKWFIDAATALASIGTCARCIYRLLHVQDFKLYRAPGNMLEAYLNTKCPRTKPNICLACFDLCNIIDDKEYVDRLVNNIKECGYEFNTFQLAMRIPVSILIRQYAIWYYLRGEYPDVETFSEEPMGGKQIEVKEVMKWSLGKYLTRAIDKDFRFGTDFNIELSFTCTSEEVELNSLQANERAPKKRKVGFGKAQKANMHSAQTVSTRLQRLSKEEFQQLVKWPLSPVKAVCEFKTAFSRASIYLAGRYIKASRNVSQSPFILPDGTRKTESSVQELLGPIVLKYFSAASYKLASSGREDVDVRMLGRGRPFILELINAKTVTVKRDVLLKMRDEINAGANGLLAVLDLQLVPKEMVTSIREGEAEKKKCYQCVVAVSKTLTKDDVDKVNAMKEITVEQMTPIRVLHRRSLLCRPRMIHDISCKMVDDHHMTVNLVTQAGTYVKEFVHGDIGRTVPSLASILQCEADILLLDVLAVELNFPKKIDNLEDIKLNIPSIEAQCAQL